MQVTAEQALTIDCPDERCARPASQMCVTFTGTYVSGRRGVQQGYGSVDPGQIGREAKRPHNARLQAYYRANQPEPQKVLTWRGRPTIETGHQWTSADDRYMINLQFSDWDKSVPGWKRYPELRCWSRDFRDGRFVWVSMGHFPTLDEAKAACQADNEARS